MKLYLSPCMATHVQRRSGARAFSMRSRFLNGSLMSALSLALSKYPTLGNTRARIFVVLVGLALTGCGGGGGGSDSETVTGDGVPLEASADVVETLPPLPLPSSDESVVISDSEPEAAPLGPSTLEHLSLITATALKVGDVLDNLSTQTAADGSRVSGWVFSNGPEFAGAQGNLVLRTASGTPQAELQGDLGCSTGSVITTPTSGCGKYVQAIHNFPTARPISAANTRVQVRFKLNEPLFNVGLRLVDSSNQTVQYSLPANTLESVAGNTSAEVAVPMSQVSNYWGGSQSGVPQGSLKQMSVLLSQKPVVGPQGSMVIENVKLVSGTTAEVALSGNEPLLTQGVNPSLKGRMAVTAAYYKVSDKSLRMAQDAGFSIVRMDMFWDVVEKDGKFNFSIYETALQRLAARGMKALFILSYGHPDHGRGAPVTAQDREAYLNFARQAAQFAKGRNVMGFEIWNEPDNNQYWTNGSAQTYAQLLEPARAAVKSIDPTRLVMNGGISWVNLPYIMELANTGKLAKLDAFAIHPYRNATSPETFAADLAALRFTLKSKGVNAPVMVTEWGHSSAGLAAATYGNGGDPRARSWQMRMVLRTQLTQIALNLPLMTTFQLVDSGTDRNNREHNYGLLDSNLNTKFAYTSLKQLYSLIKDRAYEGLVRDVPPNVHAMRWKGNNRTVYAVWVDAGSLTATVTIPVGAKVLCWNGAIRTTTLGANGTRSLKMNRDEGVLYVVI